MVTNFSSDFAVGMSVTFYIMELVYFYDLVQFAL